MEENHASIKGSTIVLLIIIGILAVSIIYYGAYPHLPLLMGAMIVTLYGVKLGYKWYDMEKQMIKGISQGLPAILILCLVGLLIGVWLLNGTVQTITYYGLQVLSPSTYLISTVIITAVVSTVSGTSLGTLGTIGISLMGVAQGMGIDPALAAGAIVSGSIFGNKLSPLSDTTNLAAAAARADLFEHIKHMLWTTIPAFIISLLIFGAFDIFQGGTADTSQISEITHIIKSEFPISLVTLLSPFMILVLAMKKINPVPALSIGLIIAAVTTFYTASSNTFGDIMEAAYSGYTAETGDASVDKLFSLGGLEGMFFAVSLIIIALAFGGLIQGLGVAAALIEGLKKLLKSRGNTIASTMASGVLINFITGEQYLSILLPGQMYEDAYRDRDLHPKNLSRTLEDGGTMINPLVPWGVTGAFVISTLGVGMEYIFYVFFCLVTPLIALFYAYTGWTLTRLKQKGEEKKIRPVEPFDKSGS